MFPEVTEYFRDLKKTLDAKHDEWVKKFDAWKAANPKLADELAVSSAFSQHDAEADRQEDPERGSSFAVIPEFPADSKIATRKAGQDVLQPLAKQTPLLIGGSADLYGSTLNYIGDLKARDDDFSPANRTGRNIPFGIREHGMCSIMNGIAAHGIFRPSGATFLVFADYCRAAIRLAALSHLPVIYIFTHDSVGVGEDGPTHQPIETIPALRLIPNLDVVRPGDPEETAGRVRRRAGTHRWPDAARPEPTGGPVADLDPGQSSPRGRAQGRLHRQKGNRRAGNASS